MFLFQQQAPVVRGGRCMPNWFVLRLLGLLFLLAFGSSAFAQTPTVNTLLGHWKIDLRASPDDGPHVRDLVLTSITDSTFTGILGTDSIRSGTLNAHWDQLVVAFMVTRPDGSWHATARLEHGLLKGTMHDLTTGRLMMWLGNKVDDAHERRP